MSKKPIYKIKVAMGFDRNHITITIDKYDERINTIILKYIREAEIAIAIIQSMDAISIEKSRFLDDVDVITWEAIYNRIERRARDRW